MPPRWNQGDEKKNLFSPNRRKIEELLDRNSLHRDMASYEELGNLLAAEDDLDVLSSRLDRLDVGLLPPMTTVFDKSLEDVIQSAWRSLIEITTMLQALSDPRRFRSSEVRRYLLRCYPLLVDRWTNVTAWWTHKLLHFRKGTRFVVQACVVSLHTVLLASSNAGEYQEELATRKSTLDLVYALICQTDSEPRISPSNYCYIGCEDTKSPCLLIEHFVRDFMSPARSMAMVERLQTMKTRTRNMIVRALIERAEQICQFSIDDEGPRLVGYIHTFGYLVRFMSGLVPGPFLRTTLERFDYLRRLATSLQTISALAQTFGHTNQLLADSLSYIMLQLVYWALYLQPNPASPLLQVLTADGHIFKIVEMLPCNTTRSITGFLAVAGRMLPYLHSSEVFHAANVSGLAISFIRVIAGLSGSANIEDDGLKNVASHYPRLFRFFEETHITRKDRNIHLCHNLCHNLTHRAGANHGGEDKTSISGTHLAIRSCSRCRSVTYCSSECQREDWVIHAPECSNLASQYHVEKRLHYWVSSRLKQDYLRILDTVANLELPPPSELNQDTDAGMESPYGLHVNLFRFFLDTTTMLQETRLAV